MEITDTGGRKKDNFHPPSSIRDDPLDGKEGASSITKRDTNY